jgi:DNA segregation ATPase FtsK/SpoIIIE-like protein
MPEITTQRQRELIGRLTRLVARRARDEVEIRRRFAERNAETKRRHQQLREQAIADFEREHARLIAEFHDTREAIYRQYEAAGCALAEQEQQAAESLQETHHEALEVARQLFQHRRDDVESTFTMRQPLPQKEFSQIQQQCELRETEIQTLVSAAQKKAARRGGWPAEIPPPPEPPPGLTKLQHFERASAAIAQARGKLHELQHAPAAAFLESGWPALIFCLSLPVTGGLAIWLLWDLGVVWIACAALGTSLIAGLVAYFAALPLARRQTQRIVPDFLLAVQQARGDLAAVLTLAKAEAEKKARKIVRRREKGLKAAQEEYDRATKEQNERQQAAIRQAAGVFQARRRSVEEPNERKLDQIQAEYPPRIAQLEQDFERQIVALRENYKNELVASREEHEREWADLVTSWTAGLAEFQQVIGEMNQYCDARFPQWDQIEWQSWQPARTAAGGNGGSPLTPNPSPARGEGEGAAGEGEGPAGETPALRFGRFDLALGSLEGGLPQDAELELPPERFELPAVLSYPECPSLLALAEGEGRDAATRLVQNVMLRLLTTFPPGKVRFTIIDPVGLGQNFSAFMHLADFDQRLVTNRIWTESTHINQRLADLTEHMENVIQKYLRNEFESIQQYNAQAGEVAEPFQILVVANFPANFSDEAARRLVSIASSGARCGVYTLISVDTKLALPRNLDLADLQTQAATLVWDAEQRRFTWKDDELRRLPLVVETPPSDEQFTAAVKAVGKLAKATSRVEVPFETVLPPAGQWWTSTSSAEIEAPLGRAGAMKLQYLRLGKGTSQHVLIAGKTGSGKSTLLNAMITTLAAYYSPEELEFYLIDFKKGVEFKAYAQCRLPHARVIAIESEREFGLSVLERLDLELKRRGDLFRQAGVQDVRGYRAANPHVAMPRVLLVIDEFQEFFTSDDKISHDAALLLDRLVRQGRAFGIHVMLGSQTLAGAYSLARSTIGQMAVRIALQCSESDAHLILSEDNTAARLLGRPGEAIYNDANGLFEGNHPFQVVWLSDHERETYLQQIAGLAYERKVDVTPTVVFEGNVPANPADNEALRKLLLQPAPEAMPLAPRAWLGAAVAIKEPTEAVFRRQGGSNLLIVGQHEELALGVLTNCLVSLGGQLPRAADRATSFYLLDGTRPESPEAGFWKRLAEQLPLEMQVVLPRDAANVVTQLAAEVDRRLNGGAHAERPIFLLINNLARFRDLKKGDDFGSFDDEGSAGAGKQMTTILREGPGVGMHAIVWCDSYNNLNRWLDRQSLRDLEMRVLFQMSATDSSNLMDSPAASKLGVHRAMFYSEEQGQAEKFRPYGPPTADWLDWVQKQLAARRSTPT